MQNRFSISTFMNKSRFRFISRSLLACQGKLNFLMHTCTLSLPVKALPLNSGVISLSLSPLPHKKTNKSAHPKSGMLSIHLFVIVPFGFCRVRFRSFFSVGACVHEKPHAPFLCLLLTSYAAICSTSSTVLLGSIAAGKERTIAGEGIVKSFYDCMDHSYII